MGGRGEGLRGKEGWRQTVGRRKGERALWVVHDDDADEGELGIQVQSNRRGRVVVSLSK